MINEISYYLYKLDWEQKIYNFCFELLRYFYVEYQIDLVFYWILEYLVCMFR